MSTLLRLVKNLTNNKDIAPKDLSHIVSITVAEAIGAKLAIPSEPVLNPTSYFKMKHQVAVQSAANTLNSYVLVDIDDITDMAFHLWLFRYKLVHATNDPKEGRIATLIMLSDSTYMPSAYTKALEKHPDVYLTRWKLEDLEEDLK